MSASTTTTEAVAATAASLDEALERRKRIDELLKSTGESLARIARLQDSTQRLWDSRSQRLGATEQGVQEVTPTSSTTMPLVLAPTSCLTSSMQEKYHLSAQQVFDERSERHEVKTSNVLHVTVTCVLYPVTEKVLHQVFDPYGMNEICVLQQSTHVKALVELPWSRSGFSPDPDDFLMHFFQLQRFCLFVQLQLHLFYSGFSWRQEIERGKAALICFFRVTSTRTEHAVCAGIIKALLVKPEHDADMQVTQTLNMFRRNHTDTCGRASRLQRSSMQGRTPRTWLIARVAPCDFFLVEQVECLKRNGPESSCNCYTASSCHFVQHKAYSQFGKKLTNPSYSTRLHCNILHNKGLLCSITCSCGQSMEMVASTLRKEMQTIVYSSIFADYITKENSLCRRLWQDMLVRGRLHFDEVCTILLLPWDPGVHEIKPHFEMAKQCWQWLSIGVDWKRRAIAWGQAMFPGRGSVTPVLGDVLDQKYMGYGPAGHEWWACSGAYKGEHRLQDGDGTEMRKSIPELRWSSSSRPLLRWLLSTSSMYPSVAAFHKL